MENQLLILLIYRVKVLNKTKYNLPMTAVTQDEGDKITIPETSASKTLKHIVVVLGRHASLDLH
jgi:ribosomal protein S17